MATGGKSGEKLSLYFSQGAGRFRPTLTTFSHASMVGIGSLVPADLDGDGELDIVWVSGGNDSVTILWGSR